MFKYAVYIFLVAAFELVAAGEDDPKFVGKFQLEEGSKGANYKKIFESAGFKPNQVKQLIQMLSTMTVDISLQGSKLTCVLAAEGKEVSNTYEFGKRTKAKMIIGGAIDTTVFMQSEYRITVHSILPKGELMVVYECDDEACAAIFSVNKHNLVTKWQRI